MKQLQQQLMSLYLQKQNNPKSKELKAQYQKVLMQLVDEKPVGVVVVATDSYGRAVGTLYQQGVNINVAMVASGYAWWYQHYAPHERTLASSEQQARDQKLGLWAQADPVPPWDWRRGRR